jgi:hypothetical protein
MNRQTIARQILGLAGLVALAWPMPVRAHNGPPFPIIENHKGWSLHNFSVDAS